MDVLVVTDGRRESAQTWRKLQTKAALIFYGFYGFSTLADVSDFSRKKGKRKWDLNPIDGMEVKFYHCCWNFRLIRAENPTLSAIFISQ